MDRTMLLGLLENLKRLDLISQKIKIEVREDSLQILCVICGNWKRLENLHPFICHGYICGTCLDEA